MIWLAETERDDDITAQWFWENIKPCRKSVVNCAATGDRTRELMAGEHARRRPGTQQMHW